tara:strand:+ start:525 stop:734 length:210 start_codon:yes stop_codon:yes gene_type:complete
MKMHTRTMAIAAHGLATVANAATAPGGGLGTDSSSTSRIQNSLLSSNTTLNIHGLGLDLGGNIVTASCP